MRPSLAAAVFGSLALLGLFTLPACKSSGRSRTESTASGLEELRKDADEGKGAVKSTMDSLSAVEGAGAADLHAKYEQFLKDFTALEAVSAKARSHGDAMRSRGTEYFASWEQEIGTMTNADIKKRSEERRAELNALYTALTDSMDACRARYDKFSADLTDIRAAMDLDLSPGGVKVLADPIKQARTDGGLVDTAIDDVHEKLEALAKELNTVKGGAK